MPIAPDTKDWTWVIDKPCPECGFDPSTLTRENLVPRLTSALEAWPAVLARDDVGVRPNPETWSAGEYAAHIADVCDVMAQRIELILREDDPEFANWDQDKAAADGDYPNRDPQQTATALPTAAARLTEGFGQVADEQWDRTGRRSNGSRFTAYTLGVYALHDIEHHLWDVRVDR
ncbi:DinB family protein [Epidermidibacterium keratini]|uniref:DinB family protein n=1 Tax=Epidermidibacterium keratini TaxID=1891644 RepID=A0A7L4YMN4_9ACTN|nr:DinB family protein [Epidermidibacterium keratini]QHC00410.1 DinB family protein [Epidermidibacterium keratini]